ncbi:hypothetical protein [Flavobacterium piscisymbiosum]|uniref:Uncharacterized protein n=1 Tax=Flavobacterium piscisymbiosum TaxID=2893753 RepID=A0ABS8M910_9FLAO|nr:hypothetical protein [Flavobacterium sp. F-30]MCC9061979.1 hypothetical protein [Flavobacterium sp. F-30]
MQFLTDEKGNKIAVLLPIEKYNKMIEQFEDLHDVKLYDEAKKVMMDSEFLLKII